MTRPRRPLLHFARALLVIALTLLPLALEAHHHTTPYGSAPDSCRLCAVVHHTPAALSPVQFCVVPLLHDIALPALGETPPARAFRMLESGRAPPGGSPQT